MTPRRVLITGAGGFVGRSLALGFADLGWRVIGLDRAFDAGSANQDIRQVAAELAEGVPQEVPEVDLVVHAAWVTTDAETLGMTPAGSVALNLRPLLAVLEYTARTRPACADADVSDGLHRLIRSTVCVRVSGMAHAASS